MVASLCAIIFPSVVIASAAGVPGSGPSSSFSSSGISASSAAFFASSELAPLTRFVNVCNISFTLASSLAVDSGVGAGAGAGAGAGGGEGEGGGGGECGGGDGDGTIRSG